MSFLSGTSDKVTFREAETSLAAKKRVEGIAQISSEGIPLREIAGFTDLENQAFALAQEFLTDATGEITIGRAIDIATQIAESPIDFSTPEIQGVVQEVRKSGDLALNRIGRQLQKTGTLSTTAGRDILGRSISETEKRTAAALSPLVSEFRARRLQATSLLPGLVGAKAGTTVSRIGTGEAAGAAQRILQQRIEDALFTRAQQRFEFETTGRANINALLFEGATPIVKAGGPSELSKAASIGADVASLITPVGAATRAFSGLLNPAGGAGTGGGLPGVGGKRFPLTGVA